VSPKVPTMASQSDAVFTCVLLCVLKALLILRLTEKRERARPATKGLAQVITGPKPVHAHGDMQDFRLCERAPPPVGFSDLFILKELRE
jgi:hypothetical protein